jgi:hypothetical protein
MIELIAYCIGFTLGFFGGGIFVLLIIFARNITR